MCLPAPSELVLPLFPTRVGRRGEMPPKRGLFGVRAEPSGTSEAQTLCLPPMSRARAPWVFVPQRA